MVCRQNDVVSFRGRVNLGCGTFADVDSYLSLQYPLAGPLDRANGPSNGPTNLLANRAEDVANANGLTVCRARAKRAG